MTTRNPEDDELDREYMTRLAISQLMQAMAGIDKLSEKIGELKLSSAARAEVSESLDTAKDEAEKVAIELAKSLKPKHQN